MKHMTSSTARAHPRKQFGFTMVELMVATVIAMLLAGALVGSFVANSRARTELDRTSRQIENGRFALELLAEELRVAGYYGAITPAEMMAASICETTASGMGWRNSPVTVPAPVQTFSGADALLSCLTNRDTTWPAIAIRRLATVATSPASVAGANEYVQTSFCNNDPAATRVVVSSDSEAFSLRNRECSGPAPVRQVMQRAYFIATCTVCGKDSIPSLARAVLNGGEMEVATLVEGIEAFSVELGIDTNGDGSPDVWKLAVGANAGVPNPWPTVRNPDALIEADKWSNVMAVRIFVVSRSSETTAGYADDKVIDLGLAGSFTPANDGFKRRAYSTVVRLNNPAGRRES